MYFGKLPKPMLDVGLKQVPALGLLVNGNITIQLCAVLIYLITSLQAIQVGPFPNHKHSNE